jgi:hypothetical protein
MKAAVGGGVMPAACTRRVRQVHHKEDIVGHQAMPGGHFHGEEVGRGQDLPVELDELRPAHARFAALGGGLHMVPAEDIAHRQLVNMMPQVCQSALNAAGPPAGVFLGHAHDKVLPFG